MNNQVVAFNEQGETIEKILNIKMREIGGVRQGTVNARDLHMLFGSKQQFSDWIKTRLDLHGKSEERPLGFEEGFDYVSLHKVMKRGTSATTEKEYILTMNMVKHLAVLERNSIGDAVWHYLSRRDDFLRDLISRGIDLEDFAKKLKALNNPFRVKIAFCKAWISFRLMKLMQLLRREAA